MRMNISVCQGSDAPGGRRRVRVWGCAYPTMTGTFAKFPLRMEIVGVEVKSFPSTTGRKDAYGPLLRPDIISQLADEARAYP